MKLSTTFLMLSILAVQCRKNSERACLGEMCGGAIDPIQCEDGLECFYLTPHDRTLPGICRPIESHTTKDILAFETHIPTIVGKGQHCGGFIMNAPICSEGLTCILDTIPDLGGTCE